MLSTAILILSVIGCLAVAGLSIRSKKRSHSNLLFELFILTTVLWLVSNHLSYSFFNIWYLRISIFFAAYQVYFLFLFCLTFPSKKIPLSPVWFGFLTLATITTSILSLTNAFFTRLEGSTPVTGNLIPIFAIFALSLLLSSIILLLIKATKSRGVLRRQFTWLLLGIAICFSLVAFTNLILVIIFSITSYLSITPIYSLLLVSLIGYNIIANHLFDIRLFVRRTLIFSFLVGFAFLVYAILIYTFTFLIGSRQETNFTGFNLLVDLITIIIVGFSYEPLKIWISEKTDKWLFKKEYEQEVVIKELSQKLNNVIALDEALEAVMQTTAKALHLHHAVTYVFQQADKGEQAIKRIKQIGYASTQRLILEDRDFVMSYFCSHPKITFIEEFNADLEREKELLERKRVPEGFASQAEFIRSHAIKVAVAKKLEQLEVAVAMPLTLKDQPIGLILLSSKQSNENYSKQDLTLLELVGDQAISSIQKAKLYEGDQMKSEFVSIASHELLTPISAIEGYLSMILDEKIAGKNLDPQTQDYLSKCFSSAKRLSMLVKDLLSVSRIESGKMKFTSQQLDGTKSIQDTLDQLRFIAQEKNINLKFKHPEPALPPVLADPDRTSQVLINLVSNAIKYNRPGGEVTVNAQLLKKERMVSITVADNGLGMDKEQMSHLFEKFYRVDSKETVGIIGTGLGLYITKSIVERMGGAITVQSVAGKGTTFTFTLPLLEVEKSSASF